MDCEQLQPAAHPRHHFVNNNRNSPQDDNPRFHKIWMLRRDGLLIAKCGLEIYAEMMRSSTAVPLLQSQLVLAQLFKHLCRLQELTDLRIHELESRTRRSS